ncbi:MAG: diguanylate cyclase [Pelagimonas sp.]|jgi:diguanylate cyclase (GGDEF)-like protein|nr:diguanylate cyclase [Pelagimonas sp.]
MTMFPEEMLHVFCPLHVVLDRTGHIRQAGPTLHKISPIPLDGARFLEVFEVYRPRVVESMGQLLNTEGRKLHLRVRSGIRTPLKGVLMADGHGGAVINLSFGIAVVDAVRDYQLTSTDFAQTDLAIEMLYLVEAKSAAMDASRRLNTRLQGAKAEAEERAFTDKLTGLGNRRAMDAELDRLSKTTDAFSLMHLDLDLFKQVNDTMGHAAGDAVLRRVAEVMIEETRKVDIVTRVGGDEFVIIFGSLTSEARLANLAARLIERIEEPVPFEGRECKISSSIGVCIRRNGQDTPPETILERADEALYASKRAGRAQYSFYDHPDLPGRAEAS